MRVPDEVLKAVGFLCVPHGQDYAYRGTGFLVGVPSRAHSDISWVHFVTARHCVEIPRKYGQQLHLRMNRKDGGSYTTPAVAPDSWAFPENEASDVAVTPIEIDPKVMEFSVLPLERAATRASVRENKIGPGDDLIVIGLFSEHYGTQQNLPIVRMGTLSALPIQPLTDEDDLPLTPIWRRSDPSVD